jgi:5-methylcytosine-specific restriction endonuclease McrA
MADEKIPDLKRTRTSSAQWIKRFLDHGPFCHYCEIRLTLDTAVREHLTPLCRGGADSTDNLVPSCDQCNQMKAWRTDDEFFRDRPMLLARRTSRRTIALPTPSGLSLEEANEPGLLKRLSNERERVSRWWRSTSAYRRTA